MTCLYKQIVGFFFNTSIKTFSKSYQAWNESTKAFVDEGEKDKWFDGHAMSAFSSLALIDHSLKVLIFQ